MQRVKEHATHTHASTQVKSIITKPLPQHCKPPDKDNGNDIDMLSRWNEFLRRVGLKPAFRRSLRGPNSTVDLVIIAAVGVISGCYIWKPALDEYWSKRNALELNNNNNNGNKIAGTAGTNNTTVVQTTTTTTASSATTGDP